ncbi:hypothetical protein Dimus_033636 [Dionaea muscipula]
MSSYSESPDPIAGDSQPDSTRPFVGDERFLGGYEDTQRFHSFSNFVDSDSVKEPVSGNRPSTTVTHVDPSAFNNGDDDEIEETVYVSGNGNGVFLPPVDAIHGDDEYSGNSPAGNGGAVNGVFVASDGPVLPEIQEEGMLLREWRRENAILLEQKEKSEKEAMTQIIEEANAYKIALAEKRIVTCKNNKVINREKEKLFLANHEKFHKEADKNYWKSIAELIPNEVPTLEKKGKKDQEKKPSIVFIQGPKPGKPSDLSRLRNILLKLKHEAPQHLKLSAPPAASSTKETETSNAAAVPASAEVAVVA